MKKETGVDLFEPPRGVMDSEYSGGGSGAGGSTANFAFAFNDSNFSDRILRIEIISGLMESKSEGEGCNSIADWARNRKRRREEIKRENNNVSELTVCHGDQILNTNQPNIEDGVTYENQDEEDFAMVESPSGFAMLTSPNDEAAHSSDSSSSMDCSTVLRVTKIHISSAILAAKSPFFYKLFSNGMRESEQRDVTLRINASEEAALMELLNFMYSGTLSTTTAPALLDVLMAADKFEVASCMRHCSRLLRNLPMTPESALLYLELPSSVLMAEAVQPLTDAAKQYLAKRYKDLTKFQEEVMALPLPGIEAVLSSDELQVANEDAVYDFVLKWARVQYPRLEERREVLGTRLGRLIRFPNMSSRKLKKVLACNDFDHDLATKLVMDALFFKAETPHRQRALMAEESANRRFAERAYKYRPVKVVEFDSPHTQCIVFLDLKREECAALFPTGRVYSQAFHLGGQGFFLSAHCNMDQQSSFHCFGLFLGMQEKGSVSFAVDYEFAARSKPTAWEFVSKYKGNYTFTGGKAVGYRNLFQMPWTSFMAEDSHYFVNGVLHLRAELTIKPQALC
ncbi:BTB/POZ domain-containing protein POB1 isoform X4 [Amborella trichopoda]|uniref:BTB/POZ domain-containing protein POB1 isoform X3 n=1 Tax=Amborella trichopoda TaxID=13333 RepID=UPI0009BCF6B9|nr:BTB/POZ domain-containing protein POB1 isoform X3 [Amborella trichopoda]XP_020522006.1 BTB/POZ domain-containing protein POB1 isoform X4 [Amborella trichopoda]|eukprot:XP_020522005.1 BTB/POZ domain-containing protein POB1 isoform X3 [Amborella trichopoda]